MARTPTTAENMDVRIPKQCTTANPRTGPVPKISSAIPTINVVKVRVKNGAPSAIKPNLNGCLWRFAPAQFLSYSLVDQDVRVDGHSDG